MFTPVRASFFIVYHVVVFLFYEYVVLCVCGWRRVGGRGEGVTIRRRLLLKNIHKLSIAWIVRVFGAGIVH